MTETQVVNASENPALATKLVSDALKETKRVEKAQITPPSPTVVTLPGGYITLAGEVITEVEVKELTGRDEEAISKADSTGRMLNTILNRGTVRIGDEEASEQMLDQLLAGDRDAILLGIYVATFGPESELTAYCRGCEDYKSILMDVHEDVEVKKLSDPISDRRFVVKGRNHEYSCTLPNGKVQKELLSNDNRTLAELTTILLEGTVREINGRSVISKSQIQDVGIADRRAIADELGKRSFGPVVDKVEAECPDCGGKVVAPINIGTLFRF